MADDYRAAAKGGLKLKGGVSKPRKKRRDKDARAAAQAAADAVADAVTADRAAGSDDAAGAADDVGAAAPARSTPVVDTRTPAQRRHDEIQRKRMEKNLEHRAAKSHRERIEEYNKHLSSLSEHHDMPRIGPG
ncbi:DUF1754-domain-containing protein [Dipodascopsis tothii]|uniref:DUF1754-domain-containing protein n=1 Tax=Dipodascopsis tothii TaxID=44089 RepID=UPI0034CECF47